MNMAKNKEKLGKGIPGGIPFGTEGGKGPGS
jgi:hypothetical protein